MTTYPIDVLVDYLDAAERTTTLSYRLRTRYDDAANAGDGNWPAVAQDADDLVAALEDLTMDQIPTYRLLQNITTGSLSANVAANNQVRAFTRVLKANGEKGSFEVAAWDDATFDEDNQNLLSPAYDLLAGVVAALIEDPEDGSDFSSVSYTQSRTHKSRNIVHD